MNLVETLTKDNSRSAVLKIVRFTGTDPKRFAKLLDVFFAGPYRMTQRSARPLVVLVRAHPELLSPHLKGIVQGLKQSNVDASVLRNTLKLLQLAKIPKALQGYTAKVCFDLLQNTRTAIAMKVFSMSVLANLAMTEPDLKNELIILIEDQLPYASPGFLSRARRVLKKLKP
jgi:hypothetical protein